MKGPATLKLNGWTVSCEFVIDDDGVHRTDGSVGILLKGRGASLLGAGGSRTRGASSTTANRVIGCDQNVVVAGEGNHVVAGVTTMLSGVSGFTVASDKNELTGNSVLKYFPTALPASDPNFVEPIANEGNGFVVEGGQNALSKNVSDDNEGEDGDGNGFVVEGAKNHLEGNIARDNVVYGFSVIGSWNTLDGNAAIKNEDDGFNIGEEAEGNTLKHNRAVENGDGNTDGGGDGFEVQGSSNHLKSNTADSNFANGINVTGADNLVTENVSTNNPGVTPEPGLGPFFDLVDENEKCGDTRWYKNISNTRNRACIR